MLRPFFKGAFAPVQMTIIFLDKNYFNCLNPVNTVDLFTIVSLENYVLFHDLVYAKIVFMMCLIISEGLKCRRILLGGFRTNSLELNFLDLSF